MRYFLNKLDTSPQIDTTSFLKGNPIKGILITGIILLFFISISAFFILNYDPSNPNAEKDLTALHERYKKGEKLDEKEFALYCLLLEKIWKQHLLSCYCPDGVFNPTIGIDWTNPPNSPEKLGREWEEVTNEKAKENGNSRLFVNKVSKEKISFDKGIPNEPGFRGIDHWHRHNLDQSNDLTYYLDQCGKPVKRKSKESHIIIRNLKNEN